MLTILRNFTQLYLYVYIFYMNLYKMARKHYTCIHLTRYALGIEY